METSISQRESSLQWTLRFSQSAHNKKQAILDYQKEIAWSYTLQEVSKIDAMHAVPIVRMALCFLQNKFNDVDLDRPVSRRRPALSLTQHTFEPINQAGSRRHHAIEPSIDDTPLDLNNTVTKQALLKACILYPRIHAWAYTAYEHAERIAARTRDRDRQQQQFLDTINMHWKQTFHDSPVEPDMWVQVFCHDYFWTLNLLLVISGVLAIIMGSCGLTIPIVGTALVGAGIQCTLLIIVGVTMTAVGATNFSARAIIQDRWDRENRASQERQTELETDITHELNTYFHLR